MKTKSQENVGIWIDHKTAYIITLKNKRNTISKIESNVGSHSKLSRGSQFQNNTGEIASESKYSIKYEICLNVYYEKIIKLLNFPESIVVCGPGRAKIELLKRMENSNVKILKSTDTRNSEKMSENQIIAYIKDFFQMA